MTTTIDLPTVPSLWRLYKRNKRKTDEYKAWIQHAGLMLNRQRIKPVSGPVAFHLLVEWNARRDLDNYVKATLDLLKTNGVIKQDSMQHVPFETQGCSDEIKGMRVTLEPFPHFKGKRIISETEIAA